MSDRGDGFFYDGPESDSELGAFIWGVLFGALGGLFILSVLGVQWWQ